MSKQKPKPAFRVYAHFQDGSVEWWEKEYSTASAAFRAVRHFLNTVWSGDPHYVVYPDGSEKRVEPLPRKTTGCGICNDPNCDNPGGKH